MCLDTRMPRFPSEYVHQSNRTGPPSTSVTAYSEEEDRVETLSVTTPSLHLLPLGTTCYLGHYLLPGALGVLLHQLASLLSLTSCWSRILQVRYFKKYIYFLQLIQLDILNGAGGDKAFGTVPFVSLRHASQIKCKEKQKHSDFLTYYFCFYSEQAESVFRRATGASSWRGNSESVISALLLHYNLFLWHPPDLLSPLIGMTRGCQKCCGSRIRNMSPFQAQQRQLHIFCTTNSSRIK